MTVKKLSELILDEHNANLGTERGAAMLDKSLRQYGAGRSILVDKHGTVIAGNKTLERAIDVGLEDVVVVQTDGSKLVAVQRMDLDLATDPAARELAYADNRVGQVSLDFDVEQLAADIEMGIDLSGLWQGFELDELLAGIDGHEPPDDPGPQVDKAAELQEKWQVERGQVWGVGRHRVMCGDSTCAEDVGRLMGGEKAQLGITSPPYAVGKEYETDISFTEHLIMLRGVADMALEVIEPGGFWFINFGEIAAQSHTKPLTGSTRQCLYPISKDYWQICHIERNMDLYAQRIWYKPFNRLQQPFWTYHTSIPHYQEWEHLWTWRLPGGDGDQCFDWDISSRAVWDTRNEATHDKPLTRHVAAFPVCLPERAIKAHSAKGAIIWEPFCGSGTTIVVCEQTARIGYGMEICEKYVAVTLERLSGMGLEPKLLKCNSNESVDYARK